MQAEEDCKSTKNNNEPVSSSPHLQLSLSSQNPALIMQKKDN